MAKQKFTLGRGLDALISNSGAYSRSEIKVLVKKGRVSVNGQTVKDYSLKISETDTVAVDGNVLDTEKYVYIVTSDVLKIDEIYRICNSI